MATKEQNRAAVEDFFRRWSLSREELVQSFFDLMTDDCVFENVGFPTTTGPADTLEKMIEPCIEMIDQDTIQVVIRAMLVDERVAFHERVDNVIRPDGSPAISVPVNGVMEFTDEGRVKAWREYFDPAPIMTFIEDEAERRAGTG